MKSIDVVRGRSPYSVASPSLTSRHEAPPVADSEAVLRNTIHLFNRMRFPVKGKVTDWFSLLQSLTKMSNFGWLQLHKEYLRALGWIDSRVNFYAWKNKRIFCDQRTSSEAMKGKVFSMMFFLDVLSLILSIVRSFWFAFVWEHGYIIGIDSSGWR